MIYLLKPDFQTHDWTFFLNQGCQSLIEKEELSSKVKYFQWGVPLRVGLSVSINFVRKLTKLISTAIPNAGSIAF